MLQIAYDRKAPPLRTVECLALFLAQDDVAAPPFLRGALSAQLRRAVAGQEFEGKSGQVCTLWPAETHQPVLLLVGLGKGSDLTREGLRRAAGLAGKRMASMSLQRAAALIPPLPAPGRRNSSPLDAGEALAEGILLGAYTFEAYRQAPAPAARRRHLRRVVLHDPHHRSNAGAVARGAARGEAVRLARDLGNQPSNVMTPAKLAAEARAIARRRGLTCQVLERAELQRLGMGMLLGVSQGSHESPRLIVLEYRPRHATRTLLFVGKGITFDSGGISIKPAPAMDEMKFDMCGAAAVLGALDAVGRLKPDVHVVGLVPTCENMPGGGAIKPGDILKSYAGTYVEVLNTDAEGRLILGDALAYGIQRFKPNGVVDLATLTGACVIALGHYASGAISNDPAFQEQVVAAGRHSGDIVWPLPAFPEYEELLKGKTAQLQNIGPREAGAITAGLFLKAFVGQTPWVHLDIAGTAWGVKNIGHVPDEGATGVGVCLLIDLALGATVHPAPSRAT